MTDNSVGPVIRTMRVGRDDVVHLLVTIPEKVSTFYVLLVRLVYAVGTQFSYRSINGL